MCCDFPIPVPLVFTLVFHLEEELLRSRIIVGTITFSASFVQAVVTKSLFISSIDSYFSLTIVQVIKSRRMRWAGHVAQMG
jgi:hypothetical protein